MVCTTWAVSRTWVPLQYEKNEPVFHAPWEGRIYALNRAMRAWRKWSLDTDRHGLELMPPVDYLRMSYYERWVQQARSAAWCSTAS